MIIKKILDKIALIENIICTVGLWLTTILIFLSVINRYWVHLPIMWFNDLALYCFIFFMLVAAALTTREKGHIAVDVFRKKIFKDKIRANVIYDLSLDSISIIIVSIFLPITYKFMLRSIKYPEYGTLVRWFNTSWLMSTLFVAISLILIHLLISLEKDIIKLKKINTKYGGKK